MTIDEYGAIWLSNPWLAFAMLLSVAATLCWCHRWITAGRAPRPRRMAIRIPRMRRVPAPVRSGDLRALPRPLLPLTPRPSAHRTDDAAAHAKMRRAA